MTGPLRSRCLAGVVAVALVLAATIPCGGPLAASASRPSPPASRPSPAPGSPQASPAPIARPVAEDAAAVRRRMVAVLVDETNRERAKRRLPELALSRELGAAAQAHAEDMLARGYFA